MKSAELGCICGAEEPNRFSVPVSGTPTSILRMCHHRKHTAMQDTMSTKYQMEQMGKCGVNQPRRFCVVTGMQSRARIFGLDQKPKTKRIDFINIKTTPTKETDIALCKR